MRKNWIVLMILGALMIIAGGILGVFLENVGLLPGGLFQDIILGGASLFILGFIFVKLNLIQFKIKGKAPWFTIILLGAAIFYAAGLILKGLDMIAFLDALPWVNIILSGAISILIVDFVFEKTGVLII